MVGFRGRGRSYLYHPLFTAGECVDQESDSFLERVFGGSLKSMLAHFIERRSKTHRYAGWNGRRAHFAEHVWRGTDLPADHAI